MLPMSYCMSQMWHQWQSVEVSLGASESSASVTLPTSPDSPFCLYLKTQQSFITAKKDVNSQVQTWALVWFLCFSSMNRKLFTPLWLLTIIIILIINL